MRSWRRNSDSTLVGKKHRRKIYRGKAHFKKWLVTWKSGRYHFPRWPYIPLPFIVARCHAKQCFNRPFTITGEKATKWNFIGQVGPLLSSSSSSVSPPQLWKCNKPETCWGREGEKLLQVACNHGYPYLASSRVERQ